MSTEIKPGQVWAWRGGCGSRSAPGVTFEIVEASASAPDVTYRYLPRDGYDSVRIFAAPAKDILNAAALLVETVNTSEMTHEEIAAISDEETAEFLAPAATPAPLDPSADDALAASLQRLGKVWGEYREQQVRGAAKALDVVAASIQQVVDAANAVHQPASEPEPLVEGRLYEVTAPDGRRGRAFYKPIDGIRANHPWVSEDETRYRSDAVTDVRPLVVIDPAAVDVDALAEALRREWSGKDLDVTFSWSDIAKTVLTELGIEATS